MSPFRVILIFIILSLFGLAVLPLVTVNLQPDYSTPQLNITFSLPQSAPDLVEHEATGPIENVLSRIKNVKKIESVSNYNNGSITLSFDKYTDIDFKRLEVAQAIRQLYPGMHSRLTFPVISKGKNGEAQAEPMLAYNINAPFNPYEIKRQIKEVIEGPVVQLEGIAEILISGAEALQVVVVVDRHRLRRYGIVKSDIIRAIQEKCQPHTLGLVSNVSGQQFFVKTSAEITDIRDLEDLVVQNIYAENGTISKITHLKEIADIYVESQDPNHHFRINGMNAVHLAIFANEGVNKLVLTQNVKEVISTEMKKLPKGFSLYLDHDETKFIGEELDKIYYRTVLSAVILLLFILLLHRSWKYVIVLFTSIIVNLSITAGLVFLLGINVHLYTLAGITVSFGLIMDNAIVMLDHLHRRQNRKIFIPLLAASLTTMAAMMIMFLLPKEEIQNLAEFAMVISVNLFVSLAVAIGYLPAANSLIYRPKSK